MKKVFVLNGPNLNLLGTREPAVYGSQTLDDVKKLCQRAAKANGLALDFRQSNHEGDLVDALHEAGRLHGAALRRRRAGRVKAANGAPRVIEPAARATMPRSGPPVRCQPP